ncbi:MAG: hypothetical protein AAF715_30690 [Myxococcota bacterium]
MPGAQRRLREFGSNDQGPFSDMDAAERMKLHAALDQAEADMAACRKRPIDEFLHHLRAR